MFCFKLGNLHIQIVSYVPKNLHRIHRGIDSPAHGNISDDDEVPLFSAPKKPS